MAWSSTRHPNHQLANIMSATTYGSINFSVSDETALYTETVSEEMTSQFREIVSGGGEIVAGANFRHQGTFSMEGALKTSGSPSWDLGTALTLANTVDLSTLVSGYTSGAKFIILSNSASQGAEAEERRTISGNVYPFLAAVNP